MSASSFNTAGGGGPPSREQELSEWKQKLLKAEADLEVAKAELEKRTAVVDKWTEKIEEAKTKEERDFAKEERDFAKEERDKVAKQQELALGRVRDLEAQITLFRSARQGSRKRLVVVDAEERGVAKFMKEMTRTPLPLLDMFQLSANASLQERTLALGMKLNDQKERPDRLLIRECYSTYFSEHVRPAVHSRTPVFIGGPQGVGKSVFTDLIALALFEEGKVVVLEHYGKRLLLARPSSDPNGVHEVQSALEICDFDPTSFPSTDGCVFSLDDALFKKLCTRTNLVLIQDLGDSHESSLYTDEGATKVWISSPNAPKLKILRNVLGRVDLYIPAWTLNEIEHVAASFNPHHYDAATIKARFNKFGGVPRSVLEMTVLEAEQRYNGVLSGVSLADLKAVFQVSFTDLPKGDISGLLLHSVPKEGNIHASQNVFASKQICSMLFHRLVNALTIDVHSFATIVRSIPDFGQFSGTVLEREMHSKIPAGGVVKIRPLGKRGAHSEFVETNLQPMISTFFEAKDFKDVKKSALKTNHYFRPKSKIFETLDAFAILPCSVFEEGAKGLCVASFQSTVSERHKTNGTVLVRLHHFVEIHLGKIPTYHVFLTGVNGIRTAQTVTQDGGKPYEAGREPKIQQYAMSLGNDFDVLFDAIQSYRESEDE